MDEESKKMLEVIMSKSQEDLSTEERGFLMARRSYLNDEQKKRYADMIEEHEGGKSEKPAKPAKK